MVIGLREVARVCKELGWKCSEETIKNHVVMMIAEDIFTKEQLEKIAERTMSGRIRVAAMLKLQGASKSEILSALEVRL